MRNNELHANYGGNLQIELKVLLLVLRPLSPSSSESSMVMHSTSLAGFFTGETGVSLSSSSDFRLAEPEARGNENVNWLKTPSNN